MLNLDESRGQPRMTIDCDITYHIGDQQTEKRGQAVNLSNNGLLMTAPDAPMIGETLEIHVTPGTNSIAPLHLQVEVVRVTSINDKLYEIAGKVIQFL